MGVFDLINEPKWLWAELVMGHIGLDFCRYLCNKFTECRSCFAQILLVSFHEIGWIIRCNQPDAY